MKNSPEVPPRAVCVIPVRVAVVLVLAPSLAAAALLLRPTPVPAAAEPPNVVIKTWSYAQTRARILDEVLELRAPRVTTSPNIFVSGDLADISDQATLRFEGGKEVLVVPARPGRFDQLIELDPVSRDHLIRVTLCEWNGEAARGEVRVYYHGHGASMESVRVSDPSRSRRP